jgi:hypothetical protein
VEVHPGVEVLPAAAHHLPPDGIPVGVPRAAAEILAAIHLGAAEILVAADAAPAAVPVADTRPSAHLAGVAFLVLWDAFQARLRLVFEPTALQVVPIQVVGAMAHRVAAQSEADRPAQLVSAAGCLVRLNLLVRPNLLVSLKLSLQVEPVAVLAAAQPEDVPRAYVSVRQSKLRDQASPDALPSAAGLQVSLAARRAQQGGEPREQLRPLAARL